MEEKKSLKISLSTFFLFIAIIVIIIMACYIYMERTNSNKEIADLEANSADMQNTINDLQGKIDSISNTINSDKVSEDKDNTTTNNKLPDNKSEIKSVVQKYFDIRQILASDTLNALVELGLKSEYQSSDDYKGFSYDKPYDNSYFLITDISYSDFENAISKYMTLDLFKKQYPDYVMNKDDMLCIYSDGGTSGSMTVKYIDISNNTSGTYTCDVTITRHADDDGSNSDEKFTITVIENNGKYIVSNCQ